MLKHLYIKNFTLIDELDIDFHPGFSVITGETGAGKSIILGAIHLLMGQRADSKQVKGDAAKCIIEATFDVSRYDLSDFMEQNEIDHDEQECLLRREVSATGKSRAFINDTPVALGVMRDLGEKLIDVHSQHQNLLLQKEDFQLNVVDILANNQAERQTYQQAFLHYQHCNTRYKEAVEQTKKSKENEEYIRYQWTELDNAHLQIGEQAELEQQLQTLSHAEEIKEALYTASQALSADDSGCLDQLHAASHALESIVEVFPEMRETAERVSSAYIEVKDLADDLTNRMEQVEFDPQLLEKVSARLDLLYALEQRFHVDSDQALVAERDRLREQLDAIDGGEEHLDALRADVQQALQQCEEQAMLLTATRQKAAQHIEEELKRRLVPLGIPNVRFNVEFTHKECSLNGADRVAFLFSANSSSPLQPVAQVASGGEVARVMLSIKALISGAVKLPTIIFDEIDTGVSGRVAEQMAQIMREMGDQHRQVISITHLPQIAALGNTHYKVSKSETTNGTVSQMQMLDTEERVREIAQMLSGSDVSQAAIDNARSLLKL